MPRPTIRPYSTCAARSRICARSWRQQRIAATRLSLTSVESRGHSRKPRRQLLLVPNGPPPKIEQYTVVFDARDHRRIEPAKRRFQGVGREPGHADRDQTRPKLAPRCAAAADGGEAVDDFSGVAGVAKPPRGDLGARADCVG